MPAPWKYAFTKLRPYYKTGNLEAWDELHGNIMFAECPDVWLERGVDVRIHRRDKGCWLDPGRGVGGYPNFGRSLLASIEADFL